MEIFRALYFISLISIGCTKLKNGFQKVHTYLKHFLKKPDTTHHRKYRRHTGAPVEVPPVLKNGASVQHISYFYIMQVEKNVESQSRYRD
jgi:hypothetical protein